MFITFEGPEGSGKTTQIQRLAQTLTTRGYAILSTREPGGTSISDQIRTVLLTNLENRDMHARTEILLFLAARAQLVEQVIRPALAAGTVVLCDRYADSTLAYQGYGRGYDQALLHELLDFATGGLRPDLTLLFDLDPVLGLSRRKSGGKWDRLDGQELDFHRRVRAGYLEMAAAEPARWVRLDASRPPDQVEADTLRVVMERLS